MWTAHENRYATALKSRGQQKDADHTFPTLFHRLTTIAPERKEWEQGACGAKFNEFFFGKKIKRKNHRIEKIHAKEKICFYTSRLPVATLLHPARSAQRRFGKKRGGEDRGRLSKRFLAVAGTFGKENNQKRRRCALRELTGTYPQSQERPQDLARRQLWGCVNLRLNRFGLFEFYPGKFFF